MRRFGVTGVALATALALPLAITLITVPHEEVSPGAQPAAGRWRVQQAGEVLAELGRRAQGTNRNHAFYFTRAVYSSGGYGYRRRGSWDTDFPKADRQFLAVLGRLAHQLDSYDQENPVQLDDPNLRRFPFLYAVEVGHMNLADTEIQSLRNYLLAGGFLIVDDFWGSYEWEVFVENITRVLPEYTIVDLPMSHPLFRAYYEIEQVEQVPSINNGCGGGPYYERDGIVPMVKAIFNEKGRMLVLISWNSDLGDAWEWMEQACYPLKMSTYAYQLGVNTIVYAMSH